MSTQWSPSVPALSKQRWLCKLDCSRQCWEVHCHSNKLRWLQAQLHHKRNQLRLPGSLLWKGLQYHSCYRTAWLLEWSECTRATEIRYKKCMGLCKILAIIAQPGKCQSALMISLTFTKLVKPTPFIQIALETPRDPINVVCCVISPPCFLSPDN